MCLSEYPIDPKYDAFIGSLPGNLHLEMEQVPDGSQGSPFSASDYTTAVVVQGKGQG